MITVGESVEKKELSYTVGGTVHWYNHYRKQYGGSSKTKNGVAVWSSNPIPGHISKPNYNSERYMHPYDLSHTTGNSQGNNVLNVHWEMNRQRCGIDIQWNTTQP